MTSLAERYRKLYCGVVYDALYYDLGYRGRFVVNRGISLLSGEAPIAGPAFTCWGSRPTAFKQSEEDVLSLDETRFEIFAAIQPGDVVVMDTDRDTTVAHFGDITAHVMAGRGVTGAVIDGYTRDLSRIRHLGFPLCARGAQPQDAYGKWGLLSFGTAVQLETSGGNRIAVHPKDWIFADADGVLVIPCSLADETCEKAEARMDREDEIRWELETCGPRDVYARLGRW